MEEWYGVSMGHIEGAIREFRILFADLYRAVLQACKGISEVECVGPCLLRERR